MIAEGDNSVSLYIRRRDEIGVLSRTLTQLNDSFNERLKAMKIMNLIDKAVLSPAAVQTSSVISVRMKN